ncbi:MAG: response regulator [Myxococcaceae bacterium]|nr:response regulator [Myxococcaceae bacterium]MCI0669044.1 response regulator [Myxococcaceae bacterium]
MDEPSVLIVDDDTFVREFLKDALKELPLRIREAANGEEALRLAVEETPRVVLLDLMMPRKSGLEVLEEMRVRFPSSRVVVISSLDAEMLIQQALSQGAFSFIGKPFHPLEVADAVREALKG